MLAVALLAVAVARQTPGGIFAWFEDWWSNGAPSINNNSTDNDDNSSINSNGRADPPHGNPPENLLAALQAHAGDAVISERLSDFDCWISQGISALPDGNTSPFADAEN